MSWPISSGVLSRAIETKKQIAKTVLADTSVPTIPPVRAVDPGHRDFPRPLHLRSRVDFTRRSMVDVVTRKASFPEWSISCGMSPSEFTSSLSVFEGPIARALEDDPRNRYLDLMDFASAMTHCLTLIEPSLGAAVDDPSLQGSPDTFAVDLLSDSDQYSEAMHSDKNELESWEKRFAIVMTIADAFCEPLTESFYQHLPSASRPPVTPSASEDRYRLAVESFAAEFVSAETFVEAQELSTRIARSIVQMREVQRTETGDSMQHHEGAIRDLKLLEHAVDDYLSKLIENSPQSSLLRDVTRIRTKDDQIGRD